MMCISATRRVARFHPEGKPGRCRGDRPAFCRRSPPWPVASAPQLGRRQPRRADRRRRSTATTRTGGRRRPCPARSMPRPLGADADRRRASGAAQSGCGRAVAQNAHRAAGRGPSSTAMASSRSPRADRSRSGADHCIGRCARRRGQCARHRRVRPPACRSRRGGWLDWIPTRSPTRPRLPKISNGHSDSRSSARLARKCQWLSTGWRQFGHGQRHQRI